MRFESVKRNSIDFGNRGTNSAASNAVLRREPESRETRYDRCNGHRIWKTCVDPSTSNTEKNGRSSSLSTWYVLNTWSSASVCHAGPIVFLHVVLAVTISSPLRRFLCRILREFLFHRPRCKKKKKNITKAPCPRVVSGRFSAGVRWRPVARITDEPMIFETRPTTIGVPHDSVLAFHFLGSSLRIAFQYDYRCCGNLPTRYVNEKSDRT
jgi:hypothetical protein